MSAFIYEVRNYVTETCDEFDKYFTVVSYDD
jgi:hypothetical protein